MKPAELRPAAFAPPLPETFWQALEQAPHAHDLFHVLRWIDARAGARLPLGRDSQPRHEPVRLRQAPTLAFAPANLAAARAPQAGRPAEISQYGFGLFGPNGPLPLHLTEQARERLQHHGDGTLAAFADLFHHRMGLLFYRAWADAQSTVGLDRGEERFSRYVASLLHLGQPSLRRRDEIPDHARYRMAGHLLRQTRNPEGLKHILQDFFGVPVRIREFVPQWIRLPQDQQLALGGALGLGRDTVLGRAMRDAQHRFRIELGPMPLARYRQFLPGQKPARQLLQWVRQYVGLEYAWDVRPLLDPRDAQGLSLGQPRPLGLASWLGRRDPARGPAADLTLDYEARLAARARAGAPENAMPSPQQDR
ncbi:type VI secretion system baseplate subunit TssG [Orrella sp. JC864]